MFSFEEIITGPIELLIAFVGISGFGFYTGFKSLKRASLIEDVPTAKIRSAHQGYVEIIGTAKMMSGEPIVAPLSNTHCCWYDFKVQRRGSKSWTTINSGRSGGLFILQDNTGECLIDPDDAEVDTSHSKTWSGNGSSFTEPGVHHKEGSLGLAADLSIGAINRAFQTLSFGFSEYRYRERIILDGDPLYAIGHFKSVDDSDLLQSRKELTSEILRDWQKNPETLKHLNT